MINELLIISTLFLQVPTGGECKECHKGNYERWIISKHKSIQSDCSFCHNSLHSGSVVGCRKCHRKNHKVDLEKWEIVKFYLDIKETDYVCVICHNAHSGKPRHTNRIMIELDLMKLKDPYSFYDHWIYKVGRWVKEKWEK